MNIHEIGLHLEASITHKQLLLDKQRSKKLVCPVWLFFPDKQTLNSFPKMKVFDGAEVHLSHPYENKPVLRWVTIENGHLYQNIAFPFATVDFKNGESKLLDMQRTYPDKILLLGPNLSIIGLREQKHPEFIPPTDGLLKVWERGVHIVISKR